MRRDTKISHFTVFISSCSELARERVMACEVVDELNRASHAREHNYRLDPLLYERDASSGMGRPQSVIDAQMGRVEDADLFVCLLSRRLGSGTAEELDRALRSYKHRSRPLLVFLRSSRPEDVEAADPELLALFAELENQALLGSYSSDAEFRRKLFKDLDDKASRHLVPMLAGAHDNDFRFRMLELVEEVWLQAGVNHGEVRADFPVYASDLATAEVGTLAINPDNLHRIYESKLHQLAILGAPGSGKSRALLLLLQRCVANARRAAMRDEPFKLPVVVNAASWREQRRTVREWLARELRIFYNLPRTFVTSLLEMLDARQVVLFIDGLDEVEPESAGLATPGTPGENSFLQSFVNELNQLMRGSPGLHIVIACRTDAYRELREPLAFRGAPIRIEPLSQTIIDEFLDHPDLAALRAVSRRDPELARLAESPFLLGIMGMTYAAVAAEVIEKPTNRKQHETQLFDEYVAKQFEQAVHRRETARARTAGSDLRLDFRATLEQVQRWLGWLATRLNSQQLAGGLRGDHRRGSMLLVEQMKPGWLVGSQRTFSPYALATASLLALFLAVFTAVPCAFAISYEFAAWRGELLAGLARGAIAGAAAGITGGLLMIPGFCLARRWGIGLAIGLALGAARGILIGMSLSDNGHDIAGFARGAIDGVITLAITFPGSAYIMKVRDYRRDRIDPIEVVDENWRRHWQRGLIGIPVGIACAICFGLLRDGGRGAAFGIAFGFLVAAVRIFSGTPLPAHVRPNQAILQSARYAVRLGVTMAVVGAFAFGASYGAAQDLLERRGQIATIVNGILGLILFIVALFFGAFPVLQHYGLRIAMWRRDVVPLRLVEFLDFAARIGLLRRVGGAYVFLHDSLRGYFEQFAPPAARSGASGDRPP